MEDSFLSKARWRKERKMDAGLWLGWLWKKKIVLDVSAEIVIQKCNF